MLLCKGKATALSKEEYTVVCKEEGCEAAPTDGPARLEQHRRRSPEALQQEAHFRLAYTDEREAEARLHKARATRRQALGLVAIPGLETPAQTPREPSPPRCFLDPASPAAERDAAFAGDSQNAFICSGENCQEWRKRKGRKGKGAQVRGSGWNWERKKAKGRGKFAKPVRHQQASAARSSRSR